MSYYPILNAPGCEGWTTLCNFPPNNWETLNIREKFVNVTWPQDGCWRTVTLRTLAPGEMATVRRSAVAGHVPDDALTLLSLTSGRPEAVCATLPALDLEKTVAPAWRATLGLSTAHASTSYQGEIDPFPVPGSLLTFCPLLQFGPGIRNYLLFVNVEKAPARRSSRVEIYDAAGVSLRGAVEVSSNDVTAVPLDDLGFTQSDLPMLLCRDMACVPLYFSRTADGEFVSLEHTHPPASFVIHGRRFDAQKMLKQRWFGKVGTPA